MEMDTFKFFFFKKKKERLGLKNLSLVFRENMGIGIEMWESL